ncbi:MAG: EF-hand domain-containing protein [Sphingobium sp.]|nr:EF-hand domain-containing protein [Sphingobium sp.]
MNFRKSLLLIALTGLCSPALADQNAPSTDAVDPAPVAPAAPGAAAAPVSPVTPSQIVDREFSTYDADKSGDLNAAEFSTWVSKLRKPAADGAPPADSQTWSAGLFARADTDHNQLVSKTEMTTLLASAARG